MLKIEEIHAGYGLIEVVKGVSLEIDRGEVVAVLGPNGAGKTSLLQAIMGIIRPRSGVILLKGEPVQGRGSHEMLRRGLAMVPEGRQVIGPMTVAENLELGAIVAGNRLSRAETRDRLGEVLVLFPRLAERMSQVAGTLSGGEQQMLAIGRALMSKPHVLLLDEPSIGLAPMVIDVIFEAIQRLAKNGLTMLLVEQNTAVALDVASRCYVMQQGRIVLHEHSEILRRGGVLEDIYLGRVMGE